MPPAEIRRWLHAAPFHAFRICLADGRRVEVRHQGQAQLHDGVVVLRDQGGRRVQVINRHQVVSLEVLRQEGTRVEVTVRADM